MELPETVTLVRLRALVDSALLQRRDADGTGEAVYSYQLLETVWGHRGSREECLAVLGLVPSDLRDVPFGELAQQRYGVITYSWAHGAWADMLRMLGDAIGRLDIAGGPAGWPGALAAAGPHSADPPEAHDPTSLGPPIRVVSVCLA